MSPTTAAPECRQWMHVAKQKCAMRSGGQTNRFASATVIFLIMVAHAMLETARDALFLTRLGPARLGWAYVAIAVSALGAVMIFRRWSRGRGARAMLVTFLGFAIAGTTILSLVMTQSPWAAFVLYVWTGIVATLVVPAFWLVVERDVRIGEAKRTLAAVAAGGGLGALVGSALAAILGYFLEARYLVPLGALVLGFALISARMLPATPAVHAPTPPAHREPVEQTARGRRYAQLLVLLAVVSTVTLTIGDLMFKRILVETFPGDQLATVLGATYTGLNILALLIQIVVTPRLLDRMGVGTALGVLPLLVLASTLGFVLTGAAIAVFVLKLADGGLRNSVHRVVSEILFVPMPGAERERAKPLVEVFGQRGGQALAAGIVLAIANDPGATWSLAIVTTVSVALWLAVIATTRRAYVRRFRDTLDAAGIHRDARLPMLDGASVALLVETLASPNEREALAALDLLAERGERIPSLVLYHPNDGVVRHALSLLEGDLRPDVARILGMLTAHGDPQIRAAALSAASRTGVSGSQLVAALADPEPDVRAAAVIGLSAMQLGDVEAELAALRDGSTEDRVALAHAITRQPLEQFRPLLLQLLGKREPTVTREVLRAWELAPELADIGRLLRLLEDPYVRGDARRVFVAGGARYLERLLEALDDPRTSLATRRHLPRTISRYRSRDAAAALVQRLVREPDGATEFKILRALGRLRADEPDLRIDPLPIRAYARRSMQDAARYAALATALARHRPVDDMASLEVLRELLAEKYHHAIERVFRAFGILHPREDLQSLHDALVGDHVDLRGAAQEILEHVLEVTERAELLALLAGRAPDRAGDGYATFHDVLSALLSDPSDSLRCIAAHHVAERHLVELRGELLRLKPVTSSELVTSAFEQAIGRLDG